jgi:putative sterol carrier protein
MTYQDIVKKVQTAYNGADASKVAEHVALQFNIEGEGEGAFYLEVSEGKVNVEPYEYFDRDLLVTASADTIIGLAEGTVDAVKAYQDGQIKAEGNLEKAIVLNNIVKKAAKKAEPKATTAKKAPAKKTAAKTTAVKKTTTKKTTTTKKATTKK